MHDAACRSCVAIAPHSRHRHDRSDGLDPLGLAVKNAKRPPTTPQAATLYRAASSANPDWTRTTASTSPSAVPATTPTKPVHKRLRSETIRRRALALE